MVVKFFFVILFETKEEEKKVYCRSEDFYKPNDILDSFVISKDRMVLN